MADYTFNDDTNQYTNEQESTNDLAMPFDTIEDSFNDNTNTPDIADEFSSLDDEEEKKKKKKKKQLIKNKVNRSTTSQKQKTIEDVNKPIQTDFSTLGGPTAGKFDFKTSGQTTEYKKQQLDLQAKQKKQTELDQASMERAYAKAAVAKKNKEFLAQTKPSEDYLLSVDDEIKNKIQQDGKDETYMDYGRNEFSTPTERIKKISSFPQEKKEVIAELQKAGTLSKYNQRDILDMAAKKYKDKRIAEYTNEKTVNFYTDTSEETKKLLEDYTRKDKDFRKLELDKKTTINGTIYNHLNDTAEEIKDLEVKLKKYGDKPVFKTQEELDDYKELYNQYKTAYKSGNQLLNTFSYNNNVIAQSKEGLQSAEKEYDLAKRNYGFWTGAGVRAGGAWADMGGAILQLANFANPNFVTRDLMAQEIALKTQAGQEMRNAYLGEEEKITDLKSFGKASFNVIASQLPNWVLMYATGGIGGAGEKLAVAGAKELGETAIVEGAELTAKQLAEKKAAEIGLGAFKTVAENNQYAKLIDLAANRLSLSPELASISLVSGGQKYSEMKASNALGETKYTPLQMLSSSMLYGYAEGLSEKVTLDILKGGGRTLEALVKQDNNFVDMLKEKTLSDWFKGGSKFLGEKAIDFSNENISEQFSNLAQNSVDKFILGKNVNLLDNTGTVFKDTSLLSAWMISAPHIAGFAIKPFLGKDQSKEIKQTSAEIAKIVDLLKNPKLSSEERNIFKDKIKELSDKSETTFKNTIKDIDGMPNNTFKTILSRSNELGSILQKAKNIYNSESADKMDAIKILEGQYKQKETELNSLIGRTRMISQLKGEFSNEDKGKLFNLTNKAEDLKNEIKSLKDEPASEAVVAEKNEQLKQINEKITNIVSAERVAALSKKTLQAAKGAGLGANIFEFENSDDAEAKANELGTSLIDKDGNRAEGLEYNGNIIIDKSQAAKVFAFNVTGHEFLHRVLQKTLYNIEEIKDKDGNVIGHKTVGTEAARGLANAMKSYLNELNPEILNDKEFKERLALYNTEGRTVKAEETLTLFADALRLGHLKLEENALTKIGDYIRRMLQDWGFINIKFKDGKDVVNFLKDYNKAIEKGKLGKAITKVANEGAEVIRGKDGIKKYKDDFDSTVRLSKSKVEEVQKKIDKLENQFENDEIDYDDYTSRLDNLELEMEKAKAMPEENTKKETKKEVSDEDEVKEIVNSERGSVASDKVQKLYDDKGVEAAQDIIDLFKPITKRIVDKRRDAPGFDRELLTDEIETGSGGILDLIKSYNNSKGVPLAAYINKQLPLRAIAASRRVLANDFKKDVTEEKGLMAEEAVSEVKEKPKYKNALESNVFEPTVLKTMSDKIITQLRTLKSRIDAPVSLNRTVTPLIAEIRDAIGKQLDIDVKVAMGGKKDGQLVNWLLKNKRYVLENMTTTWLMGANGQGGIPQAIQKRIDGKWVSYPEWVDQKIDREAVSTDNAGRTSGAELVRRLPNAANNVSDQDYLGQIVGPDGNPIRGRKESLAKAVSEESAFDIILKDLENEGEIYDALSKNQERLGYEVTDAFVNEMVRQSERGNVKYSKTYNNFNQNEKLLFDSKINELSNALNPYLIDTKNNETIGRIFRNIFGDDFSKEQIAGLVKDFTPWLRQIRDITKTGSLYIEDRNFNLNTFLKDVASMYEEGVLDVLKIVENHETLFSKANVEVARETTIDMFSKWVEEFGKKKAIEMMVYSGGTFKSNSAIGNKTGLAIENGSVIETGREGRKSNQITQNAQDYWDNIVYKALPGGKSSENIKLLDETKKETASERKRDSASQSFKDRDFESRKKQSEKYQNIVENTFKYYFTPDNNVSPASKAIMIVQMGSNMETAIRKSAVFTHVFVNPSNINVGALRYEHTRPASQVAAEILLAYKKYNGNVPKEIIGSIWETYTAAVIPVLMDNNLNKTGLKSKMNPGWVKGMPTWQRYYNYATFGLPNMFAIESLNPKDNGAIIGENFVKASNKFIDAKENNITIDAVISSLSKKSKTPKGISVFDFDDTVGLTNSNVLYTMPNDLIVYHGAPKGKDVTKIGDKGVKFFATDKKEADEYARMHSGTTQQFVLNSSQIIDEDIAINKMRELGLTPKNKEFALDDASFYELIDTRFEESLSKSDIEKLFSALRKDGVKALSYTDGAQVSGKLTTSIAVIDPSIISTPKKLNGAEFAKNGSKLLEEGATFDFSEFSKVVEGKPGPMVEKMKKMIGKFGPENFFILTARPADSALPIKEFLDSIGIEIPLENITGLGSSNPQSKANWIVGKAVEGYNDFYFADDHLPNVNAVKDALDVLDVKSKIQQARAKFSKSMSYNFNRIIEENTGTERFKVFSDIVARRRGAEKGKFDFYVPASAADFELLLYNFIGKGAKGEQHKKFFAEALLNPYSNGNDLMDAARQSIKKDYKTLLDSFPNIRKKLESLTPDGDFTYDQAIRVAIWNESGIEIPGISKRDIAKLTKLVNDNIELTTFKDGLIVTGRQGKGWIAPEEHWDASTIISDLHNLTEGSGRKKFLGEFISNVEEIFGTWDNGKLTGPNMNKVEALYGTRVRKALEDILYRMTTGKNKGFGKDEETTRWSNWVNGSTGAIMFLNTRSAALQLIGAVNFLNFRDNNPYAAAKAFANQKQYWADFAHIWNSDKMKERRGGLKEDVAAAEIANAAAGSKNKVNAVISYLLKIGYTPTQLADSFAIASGGAPFYRNRIKSYQAEYEGLDENGKLKRKYTDEEAEKLAWNDFTKVSDETQQSGDPRDISKQQASPAGRLLLTFQNTAMQQSRIVKKAFLDLKNGRGDVKTNLSKIAYYVAVQNIMFSVLQQGLFAVAFTGDNGGDDDDDKEKQKAAKTKDQKIIGLANDVLDTVLRGTGFVGGVTATVKNMILKYLEEKEKKQADYAKVVLEGANMSPPIGSKLKKLYSGLNQTKYDKDLIKERGWGIMQDGRVHLGPMYSVAGKVVESTTNLPMDRLVNKIENVSQAMNSQNEAWQRLMIGAGWSPYSVGVEDTAGDIKIKAEGKAERKEEGKIKSKEKREITKDSIANLSDDEYKKYVLKKKAEREAKKDSINNLPPEKKQKYLDAKEKVKELKAKEKEVLKEAKADSIANLSPAEKAKYNKKVAEEKIAKKEERHQKYLEKKKALKDSLDGLSPRERERYKAKKKAERHQYYLDHKDEYAKKRKSKKKSEMEFS